jgi:hypothetical protein
LSYSSNIAITNQVNEQLIDIELPSIHWKTAIRELESIYLFINDNTVNTGNPNLQPSFTNRLDLNWTIKIQYFFDVYYINTKGALAVFLQNNQTIFSTQNVNMEFERQYSFDFMTYNVSGWYFSSRTNKSLLHGKWI